MPHFWKYHGLGNDYLVIEPQELAAPLTPGQQRWLCDRHYGVGGDGILFGPLPAENARYGLRIYNPDGSEAEKSGNGLRIFARHLWERGELEATGQTLEGAYSARIPLWTAGGPVWVQVLAGGQQVRVEMGQAVFETQRCSDRISREVPLLEQIQAGDATLAVCLVKLGNPHCVVFCAQPPTPEMARRLGPLVETHPRFPSRTNVQFLQVIDPGNLRIEIWERGAGYTLASGSSSCAAAAAARQLGLCAAEVKVQMPGGKLDVSLDGEFNLELCGPVEKICEGWIEELRSL